MILRGNFYSETLHVNTNISLIIPEHLQGPYKIVYLLHGQHGDQETWLDNTQLPYFSKKYNAVFIMPSAPRSFFTNLKYGRRYSDYITDELPVVCKNIFNISGKREDTAVMGCSMGGYGSLRFALSKPEQYGFCGSISAACLYFKNSLEGLRNDPSPYIKTGKEAEETLKDIYSIYGYDIEYKDEYDIVNLVKNFPSSKPKPKIYSTCGTEDNLRGENVRFNEEMKNTDFDFTYEEWKGEHDWYFFNDALKKTIEFWYGA